MDIYDRRRFISENEFLRAEDNYIIRNKVCSAEIWVEFKGWIRKAQAWKVLWYSKGFCKESLI